MTLKFSRFMNGEFEMSMMGELNFFLGLKIKQTPTGTMIHQQKYVKMILKIFKMDDAKEIDTHIATTPSLCARFQACPKESHHKSVKTIFTHLRGITDLGLWYSKGNNFNLVRYADADYPGYLVDRKSTTGMTHFLGTCLFSWSTKKRNIVAMFTAQAEYVAAGSYCAQLLWIKQ
ncbi:uncharacterized mitochondrial protein AtMg00810-like [Solanum dulcamara]|uniref:uncharacterized mitochondrial protein AtMg00810-like n=1 Tax=Solanum dulcamara TaxID=45834 RepID=UPI00248642A4|nr:uncharacterized mitochondrial protein AtMg00810-like [Solanum dulcamara]